MVPELLPESVVQRDFVAPRLELRESWMVVGACASACSVDLDCAPSWHRARWSTFPEEHRRHGQVRRRRSDRAGAARGLSWPSKWAATPAPSSGRLLRRALQPFVNASAASCVRPALRASTRRARARRRAPLGGRSGRRHHQDDRQCGRADSFPIWPEHPGVTSGRTPLSRLILFTAPALRANEQS